MLYVYLQYAYNTHMYTYIFNIYIYLYIYIHALVWSFFVVKLGLIHIYGLYQTWDPIWLLDKKPRTETQQLPSVPRGSPWASSPRPRGRPSDLI